jgi:hypothetical protein
LRGPGPGSGQRWGRERGANSKKNVLGLLPENWDERVWQTALEAWNAPEDLRELDALAVQLSVPVRPEDVIVGERVNGRSEGVLVVRHSARRLDITILPAKSHDGRYGTEVTTLKFDPVEAGGTPAYLAARCVASGGRMVISVRSKNSSRKKLHRLGQIALPEYDVTITPYVCRNQVIADCKATFGGGVEGRCRGGGVEGELSRGGVEGRCRGGRRCRSMHRPNPGEIQPGSPWPKAARTDRRRIQARTAGGQRRKNAGAGGETASFRVDSMNPIGTTQRPLVRPNTTLSTGCRPTRLVLEEASQNRQKCGSHRRQSDLAPFPTLNAK